MVSPVLNPIVSAFVSSRSEPDVVDIPNLYAAARAARSRAIRNWVVGLMRKPRSAESLAQARALEPLGARV